MIPAGSVEQPLHHLHGGFQADTEASGEIKSR